MGVSAIVVMGPSGCGKTTLAKALASRLGWRFIEGDDFHSAQNRAKMAAGKPLTDDDRAPWLDAVATALAQETDPVVLTCSALKRVYRDRLRRARPDTVFVLADLPPALLHRRLERRGGHFMPAALLHSQLATLERPGPDERFVVVDGQNATERQVDEVMEQLSRYC